MHQLRTYHRPTQIDTALELLARPEVNTAAIGGGTSIIAHLDENIVEVVDLQAIGLDGLSLTAGQLTIGAMVRLQSLIDHEDAPHLIREMARREGPNTFRHAATVGGVVVGADWESELLAALLVFGARVTVKTTVSIQQISLVEFLANVPMALGRGLVTTITLPTEGTTASARVARTPADKPIVAAIGRKVGAGEIQLALCGVAETPIIAAIEAIDSLTPPEDFRGSNHYRREMAKTLAKRVLAELG